MITRKHLPRRTFLRGLGSAIALPMLDAMVPALAASRHLKKAPTRIAFAYIPNGVIMEEWTPKGAGKTFEFSRLLEPLADFRQDLFVLSGLAQYNANALGDGGGDHARAGACFLTGVHPRKTAGADIQAGISADQIVAQRMSQETRFPSIELGCEDTRTVGNCDSGYSCAYTNSISWRAAGSPLPPETNPRSVFERLFGMDAHLSPEVRARRNRYRKSILDLVLEDTHKLKVSLGPADVHKIDEYLYAIREIEKRIESAEHDNREIMLNIDKPEGIPVAFADHVKLMFDLQVVAFQADLTRVATLMIGREGSIRAYPEIGISDPHHPLTHHRNNPAWIEKLAQINRFHVELLSHFIGKLKATPDGDGTLLDHSMVVYGSAIADGNRHTHEDLPVLLAGRGGGSLRPGQHLIYPHKTPMTNLYLTLLDRMGVHPETIGDSNGRLEHLSGI